jgi:hypothetical protein
LTLSEYSTLSVSNPRVLVQIDLSSLNLQWVNAGAGIWYVNFDNLYPEVDSTLLSGFSAQTFGEIGSVYVDGIFQTKKTTLASLTDAVESFYFDRTNKELYVCLKNYDEPFIHDIHLGVIYGYSLKEFTPSASSILYEGRLTASPSVSISRDPLFFGKMQYNFSGISLVNADGYFDTFADTKNIYGNEARILFGYDELSIDDYITLYTGIIEDISISEETADFSVGDKRKQLSKSVTYTCSALNALSAIKELLVNEYNATYNSTYFDTTAWEAASALVPNITIDIAAGKAITDKPVNEIIEDICGTVFGLFIIDSSNKFSFKIVDTSATASTTIQDIDILNYHTITYDPSEVISSTKVGYSKNWEEGYESPYTWLYDTTQENAVFLKYKTYNQKESFTMLINSADAQSFSDTILAYSKDVHGVGDIEVPMKYYDIDLGDIVNIEINRPATTMLGTKKCEIIGKTYNLSFPTITFTYRII